MEPAEVVVVDAGEVAEAEVDEPVVVDDGDFAVVEDGEDAVVDVDDVMDVGELAVVEAAEDRTVIVFVVEVAVVEPLGSNDEKRLKMLDLTAASKEYVG